MIDYYNIGDKLKSKDYILEDTKAFYKSLRKIDYAIYIRSFKWSDLRYPEHIEGIEFDIKTSAYSKSDILNTERTCVIFAKDELPKVFALRKDFPREMLHVNLLPKDLPVCPCLYEESYSELRLWLTWELFIEKIHDWYKRASDGTAHLNNQALEPLILHGAELLVSNNFFDTKQIFIVSQNESINHCRLINLKDTLPEIAEILIPINTKSTVTRCIQYAPQTFKELSELTSKYGVDLRKELSEFTWKIEKLIEFNIKSGLNGGELTKKGLINTEFNRFLQNIQACIGVIPQNISRSFKNTYSEIVKTVDTNREETKFRILSWIPIIWLRLPKKRTPKGKEEWIEDIAFLINISLGELCEKLNIYKQEGKYKIHEKSLIKVNINKSEITENIADIIVIKPIPNLNVHMAQKLSGINEKDKKYFAVGAGALGSQVITNLARLGIGKWDILDHDKLLPHNLGRHALFFEHASYPKAYILSNLINSLMDDNNFSKYIVKDFMEYKENLADYDLLFDFSASTAVVRHMAIQSKRPAIVSAFMTKNGQYLICLSEGKDNSIRIDDIEYQLACNCVDNKDLNSVLEAYDDKEIRYSGACSDITTVLPQDRVAIHAGIMSSYVKLHINNINTSISVWELKEECLINRHNILPLKVLSQEINGWNIRISENVIQKMIKCRHSKLPVETGGVLIGGYDLYNLIVYIVDIIPSPKDSIEKPYSYIRGFEGLKEKVEKIVHLSGRRLNYIGEWHSHLNGVYPSKLDKLAMQEQVAEMSLAGLPAIMIIIGDKGKFNILIEPD